ncbi:MAG: DoxX family protein, partial [Planctomycetes bacterium]|nr:DoxX family protein [Planctomycetota bacterium]
FHKELVLVSGAIEIVLGILLLIPKYSQLAAWGVMALLIAVFPANIYLYQHQEILPASPLIHLLRLALQGVFVLWAFWHTRSRV